MEIPKGFKNSWKKKKKNTQQTVLPGETSGFVAASV